jgi:hypothetical protein
LRKEPSRFPNVILEEISVSATLSSSNNGLSWGGRYFEEGNDEPSIISPTPVMTIFLLLTIESWKYGDVGK